MTTLEKITSHNSQQSAYSAASEFLTAKLEVCLNYSNVDLKVLKQDVREKRKKKKQQSDAKQSRPVLCVVELAHLQLWF